MKWNKPVVSPFVFLCCPLVKVGECLCPTRNSWVSSGTTQSLVFKAEKESQFFCLLTYLRPRFESENLGMGYLKWSLFLLELNYYDRIKFRKRKKNWTSCVHLHKTSHYAYESYRQWSAEGSFSFCTKCNLLEKWFNLVACKNSRFSTLLGARKRPSMLEAKREHLE